MEFLLPSFMFSLFGKKDPYVVIDKVWMSSTAKWNACRQMHATQPHCLFVAWFEETRKAVEALGLPVVMAPQLLERSHTEYLIIFAEHHPMKSYETSLFSKINLKEIPVVSALDEPLFKFFGGDRTIEVMKKLGMKEDEMVGHAMITSAIKNAQKKIEAGVRMERMAHSQEEWFALNLQK